MAPTPQEHSQEHITVEPSPGKLQDDTVVITGMSGLFPTCNNVPEFAEKLYKNENLVKSDKYRWNYDHPELTKYCGNVPGLDKFDAQFFMVHYRLSNSMDAMSRKLLEHSYQAIFDAGISPQELSGKSIGVYIGTCLTETEKVCAYSHVGVGIVGCNRAMFSNRISYFLNAKGPSMTIDAACSGSMVCMERAYEAMTRGEIEAAIVGASNIHLHPQSCIHYARLLRLNSDGRTKCFDQCADGQSPAECISILFLQKAKDARRVYATVLNAKTEFSILDGDHFDKYGPLRNPSVLSSFYNKFYEATGVSPSEVEYVEAFGSAFPDADKAELKAIEDVFCKNRKAPLLVGSVMSNMGYSQASTTVAALTKVCIAYHKGKISANLHCDSPRDDIDALNNGQMRIVTKNEPFNREYIAVNSMSLTGINGHVLLKGHYKPKDLSRYASKIPYLLTVSGRQESAVEKIFEDIKANPIDPEDIALFHNIHKTRVSKHLARGFTILTSNENKETISLKEKVDYYDDAKRPLWFVYSGMGSQWNGMGTELLRIPLFADAIRRCHEVLKPKGIDLMYILTSDDKTVYDNILNSFVGIAAVQIGLTDILLQMGLIPDNIIGHSVGELGCAYADGCLTAEEMILSAYYRGLVSVQTKLIHGSLAAVGMGYQQIVNMCPPEVDVACHNSPESSTISGPSDVMRDFVAQLVAKGIFAKEVPCSNIAYHSRYIKDAGPGLLQFLKSVIKEPKTRSSRWYSTSVPQSRWHEPSAKVCSSEYLTNNLLSPVLFEETAKLIPNNAVLIEVAPHGLLQAILKRYLPSSCTNIPLTRRGHNDNAIFLLEAIGDVYMAGYNPDLSILYPKVQFPVSTETRSLSHLIEWAHTEKWTLPVYVTADRAHAAAFDLTVSTYDDEHSYLRGHIIDDKPTLSYAAALVFVWDTLAMSMEAPRRDISVEFREVHFHNQPTLYDKDLLKVSIEIHRGTGKFEMVNENVLIATGYITANMSDTAGIYTQIANVSKTMELSSSDIYRMLYDRGFSYRGDFRSLQKTDLSMTRAVATWKDNWVTLIDSMIQLNIIRRNNEVIEQPKYIHRLYIDIKEHNSAIVASAYQDVNGLEACIYEDLGATRCGGVIIKNLLFATKPFEHHQETVLKSFKFIPFEQKEKTTVKSALNILLQIVLENNNLNEIKLLDLTNNLNEYSLSDCVQQMHGFFNVKLTVQKKLIQTISETTTKSFLPNVVIINQPIKDKEINAELQNMIPGDAFIIELHKKMSTAFCKTLASAVTDDGVLTLGRLKPSGPSPTTVVTITSSNDIPELHTARNNMMADNRLVVFSLYPPMEEIKQLIKQWKKEPQRNNVYLAMVDKITPQNLEMKSLPEFGLTYNILHEGTWGGYYLDPEEHTTRSKDGNMTLRSGQIGDLDSLHWVATPECGPREIVVNVHYAGLNYYDAKRATNEITLNPEEVLDQNYGMDFSGITNKGERVMGVLKGGAASLRVAADPSLLWPVPKHWTLEEAATVPLPYAHAFYCLGVKSKLMRGMNILVHGAAGALGQAAVSIALANGCQVFATVSDVRKKQFLMKLFPNLPENHIGNSRDLSFGDMVMGATKGEGCHIIISCVKGELIKNMTLTCCAASGITLDTHQVHSKENYSYGMYHMTKSRSYAAIDFSTIFDPENFAQVETIQMMMSEGIVRGYVRPLSRVTYSPLESGRALKFLAASRHRGRVLLQLEGANLSASKRIQVSSAGSYLLIAATEEDALVLRLADLLIARGALNIVIHRQESPKKGNGYLQTKLKAWKTLGIDVRILTTPLSTNKQVEDLVKESDKAGLIEGIYVTITDSVDKKGQAKMVSLLNNLDAVSRKYRKVRHFAVINKELDIGRDVCLSRRMNGLPATMLQIPTIDKFSEDGHLTEEDMLQKNILGMSSVLAIEHALCSDHPVSLAYPKKLGEESLLQQISKITGVTITEESDDKATMEQLGLDADHCQVFIKILQNHHVNIPKEKALPMTLRELRCLQKKLDAEKSKVVNGLGILYNSVDTNELLATADLVFLPTASQKSTMRDDEFDCNATYLVMVPGMDGHYGRFQLLCDRLKLPVAILQPGLDHCHETVSQMAERMLKVMLKKIKPKNMFYLLGYSYGVLVALEMAMMLEERGLLGVVFCVDASPDTFSESLEHWLKSAGITSDDILQNNLVQHMYSLMAGDYSAKLDQELQEAITWEEKVAAGVRALRDRVPHSVQYARSMIEATYARIEQARKYNAYRLKRRPLRSPIIVMRSKNQPIKTAFDLGLSKYTQSPPQVYELGADHAFALQDLRCANIVNKHLDKSILDAFQKKNLCNTYLLNASTYTQFSADYD